MAGRLRWRMLGVAFLMLSVVILFPCFHVAPLISYHRIRTGCSTIFDIYACGCGFDGRSSGKLGSTIFI